MEQIGKKKPLISIIVPVYNTKEYLPRCVESLQRQTYTNLEILLVDDGSTDGTGALCDSLAEHDERIRVFHKENGGTSSARNVGIDRAEGKYLGFVDSDDYVEEEMYELLYDAVVKYGVKSAQIGRDEIDPMGNLLPDICIPPERDICIPPEKFLEELLMHRGDCSFCTKLIAREVFRGEDTKKVGRFPEGVLNEDFFLLVQLLEYIGPIVSLAPQMYHVFYRVGSNSRKENKESFSRVFADCVVNADIVSELVEKKYPELSDIAFRFSIFQRLEYMLHIPIAQMHAENEMYRNVVKYLRKNWKKSMSNPMLTAKNKLYHTLFAVAPRKLRQLHGLLRGKNYR